MQAKQIMTTKPEILSPDDSLKTAAQKMLKADFGFLPIGEKDRLVGTITDRDIVIRAVANGLDPTKTKLRDIMSEKVKFCFENDDVEKVGQMMSELRIRRMIVLNDKKRITGIISLGDIATKCKDTMLSGQVTEAVSEEP